MSGPMGRMMAGCGPDVEENCAVYGQALGTAFQIIDDVLDYDGDAGEMGKNLGDDLAEGKATLPLTRTPGTAPPASRCGSRPPRATCRRPRARRSSKWVK